ncbi:hypothetical protein HY971_00920 [Candidatus Kaiserbacteria bacterium]|nr:hypothetical protein [Candidatus Kaiserbacteria bacterium]
MRRNFIPLIGWGIVIYAVMSLAWSGLVIYGLAGGLSSLIFRLSILILVTTIAGRSLRLHSWIDVLPYSLFWALSMGVLDAVYAVPFSGWVLYADWSLWVGYGLVAIVPLFTPLMHSLPKRVDN